MQQSVDFTPYSTVIPLIKEVPSWLTEEHGERIASYLKYEEIYWQDPRAFRLVQRGSEAQPIYVPNPKQIVDSTAHYLLKGLRVGPAEPDKNAKFKEFLDKFLKREEFYSRFMVAKSAGVCRGDWVLHITADETEAEGSRISITSIDPGAYFPVFDPDDATKVIEVHIAYQEVPLGEIQPKIRQKSYWYEGEKPNRKVVWEERYVEIDGWGTEREKTYSQISAPTALPDNIVKIPVYHFKNVAWDGWDFGASEIKGYEIIAGAVNQAVTDEDVALALQGLGVYATDAGPPKNATTGETEDWEIAPARVMEVPAGAYFRRVEGMTTVEPSQSHIGYLEDKLFETSHTFREGAVDVQVAESGIALAIRFLPQLAKIEQRDLSGTAKLDQMYYDLKQWFDFYEGELFDSSWLDVEIEIEIGDKLPQNRVERTNELNNMLDRKIISRAYYRREMQRLGYEFPEDIEEEIEKEKEADIELQRKTALATATPEGKAGEELSSGGKPENKSNNKARPNESAGTEAK